MPRISGIDIPGNKKVKIALQSLYGIGNSNVMQVLQEAGVDPDIRANDLSPEELSRLAKIVDEMNVEGKLRRLIRDNIEALKRNSLYRGLRHQMGLPVRGQRTRVNARTRKGKRKTVGAMTKEMLAKLDAAKNTK